MVSIAVIFGPLTDAHVNPAVTIDFWAVGKFPTELVLVYIIAQYIGINPTVRLDFSHNNRH